MYKIYKNRAYSAKRWLDKTKTFGEMVIIMKTTNSAGLRDKNSRIPVNFEQTGGKSMKKKLLSSLLCVAMMAATLTGCGGSGDSTPASDGTAAPAEEAPAEEAPAEEETPAEDAAAEEAPAASDGTLVYWSMWDAAEPQAQAIKQSIEAFTAETGIAVDVQFKGRTGIREGLQPALDAGTNIDLFDEDIDRVNSTWGSYLLDLEELAKEYGNGQ